VDSEARYQRLFEAAQEGIIILDPESGVITEANPFIAKMLNYSHEELVGKSPWDIGLFKDTGSPESVFQELLAGGYLQLPDLSIQTKDGLAVHVELVANVYRVKGEKFIQCNIRDSQPRKNAELVEQRLRQAQKMEAVGQLAGGVAHDFNNLLGVILGYCEILEGQAEVPEPARKMIQEIHNAGTSAKNLTQRLLVFSHRQLLQPVVLDLNDTVNRMEKMLGRMIGEHIELVSYLYGDLGTIKADPNQIEQVLMNLAINARDAMPKGGKIIIATANVKIDDTFAGQFISLAPGRYVRLTFSDTGTGMDAETQTHIFEPFFSTKAPGQGTGLGLSTVFGIVKQSGGAIAVYSEPGEGTTFKVYFPRCDEATVPAPLVGPKTPMGGSETILLVDDAESLRRLTRRLLEDGGYTVLDCGDPHEALRIAEEYVGPLPLLISDVVMPGFSGAVLAEKIAVIRPETKVLYASGYNDESIVQLRVHGQVQAFLEKPFTREDLLRRVRQLLDLPSTRTSQ
jgi:PAS domain S-box-containing protein